MAARAERNGAFGRFRNWLGGLAPARYACVQCVVASGIFFAAWVAWVVPMIEHSSEAQSADAQRNSYELRRSELTRELEQLRPAGVLASGVQPEQKEHDRPETILARVNSHAEETQIAVELFEDEGARHDRSDCVQNYRLEAEGSFSHMTSFVNRVAHAQSQLAISKLLFENPRWPEYDGRLHAVFLLCVLR